MNSPEQPTPTRSTPAVDIIVPARNEEHRIGPMLHSYAKRFAGTNTTLTVVLNDCTDNTKQVVTQAATNSPTPITVIDIPEAVGKGGAILAGWNQSTADILAFVDADGATTAAEFARLREQLGTHDGVIASRLHPDSMVTDDHTRIRPVMSRAFSAVVRLLFGMPYTDTQCGAKVFRATPLRAVLPQVQTTDLAFDIDLLWQLHKQNADIVEAPTVWTHQDGSSTLGTSSSFFFSGFKMMGKLLSIRRS